MAVAAAYGKPYEASLDEERPPDGRPSQEGGQAAAIRVWTRRAQWASSHGFEWWSSKVVAPIHLSRWIAAVPSLANTAPSWIMHVVVMDRDRLWLDPAGVTAWLPPALIADKPLADLLAGGGRALTYSEVELSQVTTAFWLLPTGTEIERALEGEWGLIGRPDARQEDWVDVDAAVKVAELGEYRVWELARGEPVSAGAVATAGLGR